MNTLKSTCSAVSLRRLILTCAALSAATVSLHAQTTTPTEDAKAKAGETLTLSPFTVSGAGDEGYSGQQTLSGSRSAKALIDIPSSIQIINKEQLADLNAFSSNSVLQFGSSGVASAHNMVDGISVRGFNNTFVLRDGLSVPSYKRAPMYDIDRIEVIKGPGAMLLGNNSFIGGALNYVPRKATSVASGEVQATIAEDQYIRLSATASGPVPLLKPDSNFKANYRVTLGSLDAQRDKELEHFDEKFIGGALDFYLGENASISVNAYRFKNDSYQYYDDFLDISNPTLVYPGAAGGKGALLEARLNPLSTKSFSAGRQKDAFWHNTDSVVSVTFVTKVTDNSDLRVNYFGTFLEDRRRHVRGITVQPDNHTINRQDIPLEIDNESHNFQVDYLHRLNVKWANFETSTGIAGVKNHYRYGQNVLPIGPIDAATPGSFPNDDAYFALYPNPTPLTYHVVNDTDSVSYYVQENAHFWKDRISLIGGLRWFKPNEVDTDLISGVITRPVKKDYDVYKYGIVFKVLPSVSLYATKAVNVFVPSGGRVDLYAANDKLGAPYKDQEGLLKEIGVKFDHKFSSKVSLYGSVAYYDMSLTNVRTFGDLGLANFGVPSGVQGLIQSAKDSTKGLEVDYGMRFNLAKGHVDLIATYFDGKSSVASDSTLGVVDFTPRKESLLVKYTWTEGVLNGFTLGGGAMGQSAKREGNYMVSQPTLLTAFARYTYGKHWDFQLNLDNLTDKRYILTIAADGLVQAGEPFQARLSAKYKW